MVSVTTFLQGRSTVGPQGRNIQGRTWQALSMGVSTRGHRSTTYLARLVPWAPRLPAASTPLQRGVLAAGRSGVHGLSPAVICCNRHTARNNSTGLLTRIGVVCNTRDGLLHTMWFVFHNILRLLAGRWQCERQPLSLRSCLGCSARNNDEHYLSSLEFHLGRSFFRRAIRAIPLARLPSPSCFAERLCLVSRKPQPRHFGVSRWTFCQYPQSVTGITLSGPNGRLGGRYVSVIRTGSAMGGTHPPLYHPLYHPSGNCTASLMGENLTPLYHPLGSRTVIAIGGSNCPSGVFFPGGHFELPMARQLRVSCHD